MKLNKVDTAIHEEVYPLLADIEDRLNSGIALALWINLTRKLATRGQPLEKLQKELEKHYNHQVDYNEKKKALIH
jgi:hypothetical protein